MFTGVHHTALITRDLEATTRFWRDALGLPLTIQLHREGFRHWFFQVSETDSIAFFAFDDDGHQALTAKGAGVAPADGRHFDHLALGVADEADLAALAQRLATHGVAVRGPVVHPFCRSIYFHDPNGISLEACCPL